jgi:hypothetical protein
MTEKLWVTDEELIERSGVPAETMRQMLCEFDRNPLSGFPQKKRQYGDRRYMPAVQEYWTTINKIPTGRRDYASVSRVKTA